GDIDLELFQLFVSGIRAESFFQRAALVHGGGSDHAILVGDSLHAREFSRSKCHDRTSTGGSPGRRKGLNCSPTKCGWADCTAVLGNSKRKPGSKRGKPSGEVFSPQLSS